MKLNIGIIGLGTVGRGLCEILLKNKKHLKKTQDLDYRVVAVSDRSCGMVFYAQGLDIKKLIFHSAHKTRFLEHRIDGGIEDLIKNKHVDVWVELTNTNLKNAFPAIDYIRLALNHKKHVITTNKGPAVLHYKELNNLAQKKGVNFLIEGTVMAGTPVINLLEGPLAGCKVSKVSGILNGTTNFILSEMENGNDFESSLLKAQQLGYAEADPSGDIEGLDALAKVKILANLILDQKIKPENIRHEGIGKISQIEINQAKKLKKSWKLIGSIEISNGSSRAYVRPEMVDLEHPLAGVRGNMNALTFTTDLLGDVTIMGPGAGKNETGFAVLNELIQVNRKYIKTA